MLITIRRAGQPDRHLNAYPGQTILSFLANQGFYLDAPCAGRGRCGKCLVAVSGELSPPEALELKHIPPDGRLRLACQARLEGAAVIELPEATRFSSIKGLGEAAPYDLNPPLKLLEFPTLDRQNPTASLASRGLLSASIEALNQLAALDISQAPGRGLVWGRELLAVWPEGDESAPTDLLAAALDLGTTGLSVALIDLQSREIVSQETMLNPQVTSGGDVISRITVAAEGPEQLGRMQEQALSGLQELLVRAAGERLGQVWAATISGNNTMLHLLAGVQPRGLAQAPYRPVFTRSLDLSFLAPRLGLAETAKILTTPSISAFVGGDITAGILAVDLRSRPGTVLFIDIGTNGEVVLNHQGRLVATSCAAGPALEGMNIICGQRATAGALDSFAMGPDLDFSFTTLEGIPATGLCGSGLIDVCAALVERGLINPSGRFTPPSGAAPLWLDEFQRGRLPLAPGVFLDQKDVRQVQLAKGAIAAAVEMLLDRLGLGEQDLDEIIIAGSFGFHLRAASLKKIGLIPPRFEGQVRFVGNSSLAGAARMLLSPTALDDLEKLAAEVEVMELGFEPQFQGIFLKHLGFPK